MTPVLVDSHCHLDFPELASDLDGVLARMAVNGVARALCVSVHLEGFPEVLRIAREHENLVASVGVHPDQPEGSELCVADLVGRAADPKVVAIGETGLDYYRQTDDPAWQRDRFRTHIRAARETGKPLIVHCRQAAPDLLTILREERAQEVGGVLHCFTESWEVAAAAMDLDFRISFSGIVTFRNANDLREVAIRTPLDRLLVETDSPYLAPVPHRGRTNEPGFVVHVAQEIARLKGLSFDEVAHATSTNFDRLFHA
jgi:TatD DNase family protein